MFWNLNYNLIKIWKTIYCLRIFTFTLLTIINMCRALNISCIWGVSWTNKSHVCEYVFQVMQTCTSYLVFMQNS